MCVICNSMESIEIYGYQVEIYNKAIDQLEKYVTVVEADTLYPSNMTVLM